MSELLVSLVTFAVVATISPGGATTLATASGVYFGVARSIPLLTGIALGLSTLVGIVAGGPDRSTWRGQNCSCGARRRLRAYHCGSLG
jgi:hypothetical protein